MSNSSIGTNASTKRFQSLRPFGAPPFTQGRLWCLPCRGCARRAIHESPLQHRINRRIIRRCGWRVDEGIDPYEIARQCVLLCRGRCPHRPTVLLILIALPRNRQTIVLPYDGHSYTTMAYTCGLHNIITVNFRSKFSCAAKTIVRSERAEPTF